MHSCKSSRTQNVHCKYNDFTNLAVANGPNSLLWVVLDDGSLVNEHILLGVVPVDEAIARLNVEPLDGAAHFGGNDLLGWLLLDGLVISSLLLCGLDLRVSHDVIVVLMVT